MLSPNIQLPNNHQRPQLVSRRWLRIEAQTRTHPTLDAQSNIQPFIPSIFNRFNSLTKLVLHDQKPMHYHFAYGQYQSSSINDDELRLITSRCPNITCLKLRACLYITDKGMAVLSQNCRKLKKLSCAFCDFTALLDHSTSLDELAVGYLGSKCLFEPLIIGSNNLKTLKLNALFGDLDRFLEMIVVSSNSLVEVHLKLVDVSDIGLFALSKCSNLQVLRIVGLLKSINTGLISVAEHCKYLKKLCIGNGMLKHIGNEALIDIAKYCLNLEELVLIRVDACCISLEVIAVNCRKLERLDLCSSNKITDLEISYIAEKCVALKKVLIKECCVSDKGIEAFALGCPNLVEISVTMCENVTHEVKDRLRARRGSLMVKLDAV